MNNGSVPFPLAPPSDVPALLPGATRIEEDRYIQQAFRHHSRTFSLATRLLPPEVRLPIATLYLFCRTVDGLADEYGLSVGTDRAKEEVENTRKSLKQTLSGNPPDHLLWRRIDEVNERYTLSIEPMNELLDGALWDIEGREISTMDELLSYANHVAGSVGAMMLPFLIDEESNIEELELPARSLGQAMQLTNIIRDVGEDWRRLRRVYLPSEGLETAELIPEDLFGPAISRKSFGAYARLIESVMEEADKLYEAAKPGLEALPLNVRRGIGAAARMYQELHNEVRSAQYDNIHRRAMVPLSRKARLIAHDDYGRRKENLLGPAGLYVGHQSASAA